jgi:amino acid transporter/nucleotide-binding universal stress UspA family protein
MSNRESYGEVTLSRSFGLGTVTLIGVGGMIGAGIFALTGIAAGVAGPGLVLAFLLNGCVTLLTAMAYAELGSAFPRAGGGYVWVKEALGGTQGFLAGWMSWFAYIAAGGLYSLTFGRFAGELWFMAGLPALGLTVHQLSLVFMVLIVMGFTALNRRGTSETGSVGNVVTTIKVIILAFFVLFGVLAMLRTDAWHQRFTTGFLPNGFGGILVAMGLTFIAFEGYEIIAQSAEEVIDPRRNIPKATFLSILIAVIIYILVGITAIGATTAPEGMKVYEFLGQQKEVAIIDVAQQTFPLGIGAIILLISGLVSTMSALNATTYSASRVSFAMGRDHNLPAFFAHIHPLRHTPHWAVVASGVLMIALAFSLPIEHAGAAASIMFLLLFLQVNVAVMFLRRKMPDAVRGYKIAWYPAIPIMAIVFNLVLAVNLFSFSPTAWYFAIGWVLIGLLSYYAYFSKIEAMEKPKEILLEEVLVSRDYSVLIPVVDQEQARILGQIGSVLASANEGEVLALYAVRVPTQLDLSEGRLLLKEGRPYFETVIEQAKACDVPVHTMIRLCRRVADAVRKTAEENASNLILLGWPGYTGTSGRLFGSVIDDIVDNPPTDVAVVRHRAKRQLRAILIPVGGGPNSRLAVKMAVGMASSCEEMPAKITLLHVVPVGARDADRVRAEQVLNDALNGTPYNPMERRIVEGTNIVDAVLGQVEGHDLVVIGATEEPLFKNLLVGTIPEQIARRADVSVIMVKRRSSPLHSFLRQTVLEPTTVRDDLSPTRKT